MAKYTPNLNLIKPELEDSFSVDHSNSNMDILDNFLGQINLNSATAFTVQKAISNSWTEDTENGGYYQTVTVEGILETDKPHITPIYSGNLETRNTAKAEWSKISDVETGENTITFICFEETPTVALTLQIEVIR